MLVMVQVGMLYYGWVQDATNRSMTCMLPVQCSLSAKFWQICMLPNLFTEFAVSLLLFLLH